MKVLLLLATYTTLPFASAFTIPIPHASTINNGATSYLALPNANVALMSRSFGVRRQMTSDGNDEAPRKRRTRKDGKQFSPTLPAEADSENDNNLAETATQIKPEETPPAPAPPKQNTVVMQVRDIRDVVSGAPETPVIEPQAQVQVVEEESEELGDDEEWEYYDVDEDGNEIVTPDGQRMEGRVQDDSMDQLLADARSMRVQSPKQEEETSVMDKVLEVIATIVTIDFFVVLGLLAWFLAGIFCSYVLKDDAVQIAFNMNFEGVTRPALSLLMIGSIAGSFGNKEEEEEFM